MKSLLLLHGALGSKDQLEPLSRKLQNSYDIHSLNFSGHGDNLNETKFSIPQFANEVYHFMEVQNLNKVSIFGYSMGGYVALYLASKYPKRIERIVTLATKFDWSPEISKKEIQMLNPELIKEKIPAFAKALKDRHTPNNWELVLHNTREMMIALGENQPLSSSDFQNIHSPVKLAIGNADKMVSIEETAQIANLLPNSELLILPDVQHPIEKVPVSLLAPEIENFIK